jgi:hypothetical protein
MIRPPFESVDQVTHNEESVPELFSGQQGDSQGQQGHPWDKREGKKHHAPPIKRQCALQTALPGLKPTFGMEVAGTTAMPSPPPGPGQHQLHTAWSRPDEMPKQMTD